MFWRLVYFLCIQLSGALVGAAIAEYVFSAASPMLGALVGVLVTGITWMLTDSLRGEQVLRWLRGGNMHGTAVRFGFWGEVAGRARRLVRLQEEQTESSEARLQAFLAAIQASPSGVMLIDRRNRIEWCNVTAADQFGLDAKRDIAQAVVRLQLLATTWGKAHFEMWQPLVPGAGHTHLPGTVFSRKFCDRMKVLGGGFGPEKISA